MFILLGLRHLTITQTGKGDTDLQNCMCLFIWCKYKLKNHCWSERGQGQWAGGLYVCCPGAHCAWAIPRSLTSLLTVLFWDGLEGSSSRSQKENGLPGSLSGVRLPSLKEDMWPHLLDYCLDSFNIQMNKINPSPSVLFSWEKACHAQTHASCLCQRTRVWGWYLIGSQHGFRLGNGKDNLPQTFELCSGKF